MTPSNDDVIRVNDLEKRFGLFVAVDKISFSVKKGEIFGFLGSNGSGKSTTIRMLCGIISPTSGRGVVAGHDILREPEEIKQSIGYMSQKFSLYEDLNPYENLRFYLGVYSVPPAPDPGVAAGLAAKAGPGLRPPASAGHPLSR
jgi:ABC-2 type transport system ATP-binding protein